MITLISIIIDVFKFTVFLVKGFKKIKKHEPNIYIINPERMDPTTLKIIEVLKELDQLNKEERLKDLQVELDQRKLDKELGETSGYGEFLHTILRKSKGQEENSKLSRYVVTQAESVGYGKEKERSKRMDKYTVIGLQILIDEKGEFEQKIEDHMRALGRIDADNKVDVLVSYKGCSREYTLLEFLHKLGFDE